MGLEGCAAVAAIKTILCMVFIAVTEPPQSPVSGEAGNAPKSLSAKTRQAGKNLSDFIISGN
jgi:hypothetical protein